MGPICANLWEKVANKLRVTNPENLDNNQNNPSSAKPGDLDDRLLVNGQAPKAGDWVTNTKLARTLRAISIQGKAAFYSGPVAEGIVQAVTQRGGFLSLEDLTAHQSTLQDPISVNYHGVDVWEMPPNGQGITALLALNILEHLEPQRLAHNSAEYLHILTEALRLAFADSRWYVADPAFSDFPVAGLLDKKYAKSRAANVQTGPNAKASVDVKKGSPTLSCDTVSLTCVDRHGHACSFINSVYTSFGSCIVPSGLGFALQNRGCNFSLQDDHPNALAPAKRPYHTIIPGMATKDGSLYCPFSVMGGNAWINTSTSI